MLERFKVPEKDRVYVTVEEMRPATEAIFHAMGLGDEDATLATDVTVRVVGTVFAACLTASEVMWFSVPNWSSSPHRPQLLKRFL